jgi:hypothetical protein
LLERPFILIEARHMDLPEARASGVSHGRHD